MDEEHTTAIVQRYLDELGGGAPAESAVRASSIGPSAGCTNSAPPSCTGATRA
jgi:hypothetical protein